MTSAQLRARALELLRAGQLDTTSLADLSGPRRELIADLIELPYGTDSIEDVDKVRAVALETLGLDIGASANQSGDGDTER
jgi:hypothetical protein